MPVYFLMVVFWARGLAWADCTDTTAQLPLDTPIVNTLLDAHQAVAKKYDVTLGVQDNTWFRAGFLANDNFGDTYGYDFTARKNNADGTHVSVSASSQLYTQPVSYRVIDGGNHVIQNQYATNDNKYSVSYDNSGQNKQLYYKGSLGMQSVGCNPTGGLLNASAQQIWFHSMSARDRVIVDLPCGAPTEKGLFAAAYIGEQGKRNLGHGFTISGRADVGAVASQVSGASFREAQAQASVTYQPGPVGVRLGVGFDGKFNAMASEKDRLLYLALIFGKSFEVGADYERFGGKALNYVQYNLPNADTGHYDPTLKVWVRKGF